MNLRDLLEAIARELDDLDVATAPDGGLAWSRAGRLVAVVTDKGDAAEFALDPAVGAAAGRTPNVTASGRGAGWVRFQPPVLDDHARDRAIAWFESAHRRLGR